MKNIFPKEIIENTIEAHRFNNTVKSKIIYTIILLSILSIGIALPYVQLDIYSSSRGILKPKKERNQIISLFSGKIDLITIKQNQFVAKGDTLLIINNSVGKEKLNLVETQLNDVTLFVKDLKYLTTTPKAIIDSIQSFQYQKKQLQYAQKIRGLKTSFNKTKRDYTRQGILYRKDIIAKVTYQNTKYNYDLAKNEYNHFVKQQQNQWQADLTQQENKLKELKSTTLQLKEEQGNYCITAPISGTIQNLIGLEIGSFLTAGKPIAEISPNTDLIAECYVSPADIGLLKKESAVKFQIDAYNYNQWGMATGKIIDINKDITVVDNIPMFRVVCKINEKNLKLKNGFEGDFKKGMTFTARFFIAKRTAYELLYDTINDWLNPSQTKI